ncbi:hypothetical protein [Streptomyces sp. enrichment culture]|uniref:hypothetical protein n=1 Tax=Streptomyces sp. enrichment culture TaxID=1795815 RepID=UPI003F55C229
MFLRSATATIGAAAGALALLVALPGPAAAATGQFRYTYTTDEGYEAVGFLNHPDSGECIDLPTPHGAPGSAARAPRNYTDATATVFLDTDCEGLYYVLPPGRSAGDRLLLRSVVFS